MAVNTRRAGGTVTLTGNRAITVAGTLRAPARLRIRAQAVVVAPLVFLLLPRSEETTPGTWAARTGRVSRAATAPAISDFFIEYPYVFLLPKRSQCAGLGGRSQEGSLWRNIAGRQGEQGGQPRRPGCILVTN